LEDSIVYGSLYLNVKRQAEMNAEEKQNVGASQCSIVLKLLTALFALSFVVVHSVVNVLEFLPLYTQWYI
jgi:hypothetical protein